MTRQGWDRAEYRCGSCGHTFTSETEDQHIIQLAWHQNAHALVSMLTPELRQQVRALLTKDPE
jgi:transposase-like protein